jgi:glycosyltransferase XagB
VRAATLDEEAAWLDASVNGLRRRSPEMSARRRFSGGQLALLLIIAFAAGAAFVAAPFRVLTGLNVLATALYMAVLVYNLAWFRKVLDRPATVAISDDEARAIDEHELPMYTVLVAAYQEEAVISDTIAALEAIEYPPSRLEIKLLLEADDTATITAALAANSSAHIDVVLVPNAQPRTKPKACNYGWQASSGELLTIFDAEDRPDPLQLRRAAVAFTRLDPAVACLQAKLFFHNSSQNLITRCFAAEYVTWFSALLPALVQLGAPIPLGGTSMHIRRDCIEAVGGWDPYNVTEDADLGVRLHRAGFRTAILDSITYEEANSDFVNWVRQRTRWYKGYLQTWLVHMRQPLRLWREVGTAGFVGFNIVVGATPILALLNPLFWLLAWFWLLGGTELVQALYPPWLYYPAMLSLILGNFIVIYRTVIGVRLAGQENLVLAVFALPLYWVMMSLAAARAAGQLLTSPWHWEKTTHGLHGLRSDAEVSIASV